MDNLRLLFEQFAARLSVDSATMNRHYMIFKETAEITGDIEQQVKHYIETHMPTENMIEITDDLFEATSKINIVNYLRANNITFEDTLRGYYLSSQSLTQIESVLNSVVPLKVRFHNYSTGHGLDDSPATYFRFVSFAKERGVQVVKIKKHPVHTAERDFCRDDSRLENLLELWCQLQKVDIPSPLDGYMSVAKAAELLKCTAIDVLDYAQSHPSHFRIVDGLKLIDITHLNRLTNEICQLTPLMPCAAKIAKAKKYQLGKFEIIINDYIQNEQPSWLRLGSDYPGKKPEALYFLEKDKDSVCLCLQELIVKNRLYPIQELKTVTQYAYDKLCLQAKKGIICAEEKNGRYYVSYDEIERIQRMSEKLVCMDDVTADMSQENPHFDLQRAEVREKFLTFLESNNYFGLKIVPAEGIPLNGKRLQRFILREECVPFVQNSHLFIKGYGLSAKEKCEILFEKNKTLYPKTIQDLRKYQNTTEIPHSDESFLTMTDWLLRRIDRELASYDERSIQQEIVNHTDSLTNVCCMLIFDFMAQSGYTKRYYQIPSTVDTTDTTAYPLEAFATMVTAVVNQEVWKEYDLVSKAVENPRYADAWIYLALHVFSAWRGIDYTLAISIPHLRYSAELTLEKIKSGQYSEDDKIFVAEVFLEKLKAEQNKPHKTTRFSGVSSLHLDCPEDCKASFGLILSISAAHALLEKREEYIRRVTDLKTFRDFFGQPMAKALGNKPFSSRRANKAVLQLVSKYSENRPGSDPKLSYSIASRMRSHKAGYGTLSETTAVYLQDTPLGECPVEKVVEMIFERGICSFALDAMLKNCYGEKYEQLPAVHKNQVICDLGMTPAKADDLQRYILKVEDSAITALRSISRGTKSETEMAIAAILSDEAIGKDQTCNCLCIAMGQNCKQPQRQQCMGCPYEVRTKAMMIGLCRALYQQQAIINNPKATAQDVEKSKWICEQVLIPAIMEIYSHLDPRTANKDAALYFDIAKDAYCGGEQQSVRKPTAVWRCQW